MSGETLKFRGIILAADEFKDKDKMLTVLTGDYGVIKVCARGAVKPGAKAATVSVPFMLCDITVNVSHGYYYLKEGTIIQNNIGIYSSLEAMAAAGHISECIIESIHQSENSREAYELSVYAVYALSCKPENYKMIISAFNWRLLYILGLNVTYDLCSSCGKYLDEHKHCLLSLKDGEILCSDCLTKLTDHKDYRLMSSAGILALNFFANAPLEELYGGTANDRLSDDLLEYTTEYLSIQFDRRFDSLKQLKERLSYNPVRREEG